MSDDNNYKPYMASEKLNQNEEKRVSEVEQLLETIYNLDKEQKITLFLSLSQLVANTCLLETKRALTAAIVEGTINEASDFGSISLLFGMTFAEVKQQLPPQLQTPSEEDVEELMQEIQSSIKGLAEDTRLGSFLFNKKDSKDDLIN